MSRWSRFGVVRGDEARVVTAFASWLEDEGWTVSLEVDFCDIVATRDGQVMYAEAKGRTLAPGLDVDTMFGQLLRRMPAEQVGKAAFAVVVPDVALWAVQRVPELIRELLGIVVFTVDEAGQVQAHA